MSPVRSAVHPAHFGLVVGAQPVRKIKPRTGRLTMPGWFPTDKGTLPALRTETVLETGGLAQFEVNPQCVLMATQPHQLVYSEPQSDGATIRRIYTPDLALLMADQSIVVVDFKVAKYAKTASWIEKAKLIKEAYGRDHGVIFNVITDEMIRVEPRRTNIGIMLMHRAVVRDHEAEWRIWEAIAKLGLPATIGAITETCGLVHPSPNVDRAFSAIVNLAIRGEIALDLGKPLGSQSIVVLPDAPNREGRR